MDPAVISEQAKRGVSHIFTRAARASLPMDAADTIEMEALAGQTIVETPQEHIVVLTVASYYFRLLTLFHLGGDQATADYFAGASPGRGLAEAFGERGNLCCGAMNRDLGNHFLHTGMSTPYLLASRCIPFIRELRPSYTAQYRIAINGSVFMHASLCLCAYAPIDFGVDTQSAPQATGELELF
jgi:hypothetical protein